MKHAALVADLCLIGGGHSHVLLIRRWAMNPLPGVRLTLVSSDTLTPYSGMLPGLIAGHYSESEMHIDLRKLCAWAGVRFIEHSVTGLDLQTRRAHFNDRPSLAFDIVSLDTGSTPDLQVAGAREHVTPVKPVHSFNARWQQIQERLQTNSSDRVDIGVVGSGAGGFELVTAMRHALRSDRARLFWFLRDEAPLSGRPAAVGERALAAARRAGIVVVRGCDVVRVEAGELVAADDRRFSLDEILWCTGAVAPEWPAQAGLAVDSRGFVSTNAFLQSVSHSFVFATGDIGTQRASPSAKAGVFAVRQAPFLFHNLRALLLGETLKPYRPQKDFLSLMATGEKRAIASRGPVTIEGDWVWRWKDHIDRKFMRRFQELPRMNPNPALERLPDALLERFRSDGGALAGPGAAGMRCRGCGGKLGEPVLKRVLEQMSSEGQGGKTDALSPAGDSALLQLPSRTLIQSVDQINAIVDDPWLLGRIASLHAISDVLTVDARLHSVQVIASVPAGTEPMVERDLTLMMQGVLEVLESEGGVLSGGHTLEADELALGMVVNGILQGANESEVGAISAESTGSGSATGHSAGGNAGFEDESALILTQPLGIATLFAGLMQGRADGRDISTAVTFMLQSNRQAAGILWANGARFMTDVTGFGLLGHLQRLLLGSGCGALLHAEQIPLLPGALALARQGVRSSLWPENRQILESMQIEPSLSEARLSLLCDPQTSGGLLAIVPLVSQASCLQELHDAGYTKAAVIGSTLGKTTLTLNRT